MVYVLKRKLINPQTSINETKNENKYFKWDSSKINSFKIRLNSDEDAITQLFFDLDVRENSVSDILSRFVNVIHNSAEDIFGKPRKNTQIPFNNIQEWFNAECYKARKDFKKSRNRYLRSKTVENKNYLFSSKITILQNKAYRKIQISKSTEINNGRNG